MKSFAQVGFSLTLLIFFGFTSAYPQSAGDEYLRQWVEYRDGTISVIFRGVPVEFAVDEIHARTGFQIIVPPAANGRTLNLLLRGWPLEPAIRSLITSIGFRSFAFMYDRSGRPFRAVVLEVRPVDADATNLAPNPAPELRPLAAGEKEQLSGALKTWNDLKDDARERIEDRLRSLPPSEDREELVREYGRQMLGIKN
jgi:hypothetical protein